MRPKDQHRSKQLALYLAGELRRAEVAQILEITERSVTRLAKRFMSAGVLGICHANRGKRPHNQREESVKAHILHLRSSKYPDFNIAHACEMLREHDQINVPYTTVWRWCRQAGLIKHKHRRRLKDRFYRSRMPAAGYMIQMDGSPHRYNGCDEWSLIIGIDDATSEIPYAEFFKSETTSACLKVLRCLIERRGVPRIIYTDKAGWSGGQKRSHFSQFKRACHELGVEVVFADSPEAKGRVERAFRTIQDRLPPLLRLNRIRGIAPANTFLMNEFIPSSWNKNFAVKPKDLQPAYRILPPGVDLKQVFCTKELRQVSVDRLFHYSGKTYVLLTRLKGMLHYGDVEIRTYDDGKWAVFYQDRKMKFVAVDKFRQSQINKTWIEWVDEFETHSGIKKPIEYYATRRGDNFPCRLRGQIR